MEVLPKITDRGKRATTALDPGDQIEALKASFPAFADPRKTEYLVMRSVMFSHNEVLKLMEISHEEYTEFLETDELFMEWVIGAHFNNLPKKIGEKVLLSRFMRAVFLQLYIDNKLLQKRALNEEKLTDNEYKEVIEASKRYSSHNIASMIRALEGETANINVQTIFIAGPRGNV